MLSENAFRAIFPPQSSLLNNERITFCYRPLAWITDRKAAIATFLRGGCIGFSTGDVARLTEELALIAPTSFSAPPTFWNKLYSEFAVTRSLLAACDEERLLEQFSRVIPTRCRVISIGGAMVSPAVLSFMRRCFRHCKIVEAYGSTECGRITFNYNFLSTMIDYRLESIPEMGYTLNDTPLSRGELLVKTTQMFSGYANNPEETKAAFTDDGFFRTGDIVELRMMDDQKPYIHVIDRKKSFFKLSHGQFVSPELLEGIYIQSLFVEQIFIFGDGVQDGITAIVVPHETYLKAFVAQHSPNQIEFDNSDEILVNFVMKDLRAIASKESLRPHEIPSQLIIDYERFTCENGLLTISMKPCRHKLTAYYAHRLKDTKSVEDQLKNIVETVIGQKLLINQESYFCSSLGGSSLAGLKLAHTIRRDFGISIPLDLLFEQKMTLQRLADLIKDPSQLHSPSSLASFEPTSVRLLRDSKLFDLNVPITKPRNITDASSMIFITGATGFVGAFLLAELLKVYPSNCKFACLVRQQSTTRPLDRIRQKMTFFQIWREEFAERIIALQGDLAKDHFEFDHETYENLAAQTEMIFHCGATVNFTLPYSQLYSSNICGTREVVRLATYPSAWIPIQYISTISVLPSGEKSGVPIDNLSAGYLKSGYAQSKWVAENLISSASRCGLPVTIYRLGSIGANTATGACNANDLNTLFIATILKIGYYPATILSTQLNALPVDVAVQRIISLHRTQSDSNVRIYDIADDKPGISFQHIIQTIANCVTESKPLADDEWRGKLAVELRQNETSGLMGEFFVYRPFKHRSTMSAEHETNDAWKVSLPSTPVDYIRKWLLFILHNIIRA